MGTANAAQSNLVTAIISCIFCVVIFAFLRFFSDWFREAQSNTILAGFVSSWIFIFGLTAVSNFEMIIFGNDFQAKFVPEIIFCLVLASSGASVVHRVASTTCMLFSIFGLYFVNRISTKYHNKPVETQNIRRTGGKKNK